MQQEGTALALGETGKTHLAIYNFGESGQHLLFKRWCIAMPVWVDVLIAAADSTLALRTDNTTKRTCVSSQRQPPSPPSPPNHAAAHMRDIVRNKLCVNAYLENRKTRQPSTFDNLTWQRTLLIDVLPLGGTPKRTHAFENEHGYLYSDYDFKIFTKRTASPTKVQNLTSALKVLTSQ